MVLIYHSVSCLIVHQNFNHGCFMFLSLQFNPSGAFTIEFMKMTLISTYVSTRLAFWMSAFVGFCYVLSLSRSPLPKSYSF
jgi:hypothetical protein